MYEITQAEKKVNGVCFPTWKRAVISCNILDVEAGTTGLRGGDTGHGGRTYFSIRDGACTDMEVRPTFNKWGEADGFEVMLGGDCELETMIEALKFIVQALEDGKEHMVWF